MCRCFLFSFNSIWKKKKIIILKVAWVWRWNIFIYLFYNKECCTTFNCFCWKHTKKSWKYCTFICIKIFWWQQYLDLFYTLNYFSRCCFIFILHVCYAFTLLAFTFTYTSGYHTSTIITSTTPFHHLFVYKNHGQTTK
jgi:hypothetical protein